MKKKKRRSLKWWKFDLALVEELGSGGKGTERRADTQKTVQANTNYRLGWLRDCTVVLRTICAEQDRQVL